MTRTTHHGPRRVRRPFLALQFMFGFGLMFGLLGTGLPPVAAFPFAVIATWGFGKLIAAMTRGW